MVKRTGSGAERSVRDLNSDCDMGSFNLDRENIESHYFCRFSRFFSMGLQIFLYQGLAGLEHLWQFSGVIRTSLTVFGTVVVGTSLVLFRGCQNFFGNPGNIQ